MCYIISIDIAECAIVFLFNLFWTAAASLLDNTRGQAEHSLPPARRQGVEPFALLHHLQVGGGGAGASDMIGAARDDDHRRWPEQKMRPTIK